MTILIIISLLLFAFSIYLFIRNEMVYNFRMRLLNATRIIARPEVALKFLEEFDKAPYSEMVLKFWRPISSFFSKEFLDLLK